MRQFEDGDGKTWVARAIEETTTPRHHGRWYLVFQPFDAPTQTYPVPEIRWQTAATAVRTLKTMSEFELRRRLGSAVLRHVVA